jgi:cardiolipin synthase
MFVEEDLQPLRAAGYSPLALLDYARRLARRVRAGMVANPAAVRSLWTLALLYYALAFVAAAAISLGVDRQLGFDFFVWTALGMLPPFVLTTFYLELLRDRDGYRLSSVNVPVALTLLRVVLAPGITLLALERHFGLALAAYLVAVLSDVVDGAWARRFGQVTRLGTMMDPLVDIFFNLGIFIALWLAGVLPLWVALASALRAAVLLIGGACLYLFVGPVRIYPTLFGRVTGVLICTLVGWLLLLRLLPAAMSQRLGLLSELALGLLVVATAVQVVVVGWYNLRTMTRRLDVPGRVVGDVRMRPR